MMGFSENNIHKAPNLVSFKQLVKRFKFHIIICHYSTKRKPIGRKYQHLYQQSSRFTHECAFMFLTEKVQKDEKRQIEELHPDCIIEIPFSHNQFKTIIHDSLKKRQALALVYKSITNNELEQAKVFCQKLSQKTPEWRADLYRVLIDHYISNHQIDAALKLLDDINSQHPCDWFLLKIIELNSMLGNDQQAVTLAHEYQILGYPPHYKISEITAYQSILDSDLSTALDTVKQIAHRYPYLIGVAINLAYLYIASNDFYNAQSYLSSVDQDLILDDEQYFCIEEIKTALEIVRAINSGTTITAQHIETYLSRVTNPNLVQIDDPMLTKKLYRTVMDITSNNPVCPVKRLCDMWYGTKLPHRKLIISILACYLGFIDDVSEWIDSEHQQLDKTHNIDAAIETILYDKLKTVKDEKEFRLKEASKLEQEGFILEPLAIKSKECPNLITNHLNFVNAMIQYKLNVNNNIELLGRQFKTSISVLITNLQRQNPKHPKVVKIEQIREKVLSKLAKVQHEKTLVHS